MRNAITITVPCEFVNQYSEWAWRETEKLEKIVAAEITYTLSGNETDDIKNTPASARYIKTNSGRQYLEVTLVGKVWFPGFTRPSDIKEEWEPGQFTLIYG